MYGGGGDDLYIVDNYYDVIGEGQNLGDDTVHVVNPISTLPYYNTYGLAANVENLVLLDGAGSVRGRGNNGANTLTGNAAGNTLEGYGGDDTLLGAGGNDTLLGGYGNDRFVFAPGAGADLIPDLEEGADLIDVTAFNYANFAAVQALFQQQGSNTVIQLDLGAGDQLTLANVTATDLDANSFLF
jgi:Ca2+-binding RTX toxin-like protein